MLRKIAPWFLFAAVIVFHAAVTLFWVKDNFLYFVNSSHAFTGALGHAYQLLMRYGSFLFDVNIYQKLNFYGVGTYWPPFPHLISLWLFWVYPHLFSLVALNLIYLFLIMAGIYLVTRFYINNTFYSVLAAVSFSFFPSVGVFLKAYELPLVVLCFVIWGFYFYLRSNNFNKIFPTVLFAFCVVCAMYSDRITPAVFFAGCFLNPGNFKQRKSLLTALVLAAVIIGVIYPFCARWVRWHACGSALNTLFSQSGADNFSVPEAYRLLLRNPLFLFAQIFYYFLCIPERLMGIIFTIVLLMGLIGGSSKFYRGKERLVVLSVVVPLIVFTIVIKKDWAYIFPLLGFLAVITGIGIFSLKKKIIRFTAIFLIFAGAFVHNALAFTGLGHFERHFFTHSFSFLEHKKLPKMLFSYMMGGKNEGLSSRVEKMSSFVKYVLQKEKALSGQRTAILVDCQYVSAHAFSFILMQQYPSVEVKNVFWSEDCQHYPGCDQLESVYLMLDTNFYHDPNSRIVQAYPGAMRDKVYIDLRSNLAIYKIK